MVVIEEIDSARPIYGPPDPLAFPSGPSGAKKAAAQPMEQEPEKEQEGQIDFTQPGNVDMARLVFLLGNFAIAMVTQRTLMCVKKVANPKRIAEPGPVWAPYASEDGSISVEQHDAMVVQGLQRKQFLSFLLIGALHYYWKLIPPMLVSCFIGVKGLYDCPAVHIYLFGTDEAAYTRPWGSTFVESKEGDTAAAPAAPALPANMSVKEARARSLGGKKAR
ncbi:hypothetical protein EMIHUDRAFT_95576 [Emiliania huxleyi CCMP1516]|uniref:Uncharacterized protein n=2 Tax=Emiliania huxleyi TaxID=2903 RepID=A0A0D3JHI4_EMIH1|nr:hypothetical protein EMIHUDRAFT_95576 [Emiliania huxleyi CCMP1516]EOD22969.1 hypothetical protein EMIHUDRAFT_95576 [Emiliania huxleyi CCMP1516]|eukprot:XP_005775398.1 hypothetical protein EMIHUDRAFT_95576 [Emiliania huxleyi CCMP1516]